MLLKQAFIRNHRAYSFYPYRLFGVFITHNWVLEITEKMGLLKDKESTTFV